MNIPRTFEAMKKLAAEVMAYAAGEASHEVVKRRLLSGVSSIDGASHSVMGTEGGAGHFRIVAEWNPDTHNTPFGLRMKAPVGIAMQDVEGSVVFRVLGEPRTGRIWAQGFGEKEATKIVVTYVRPSTEILVARGMAMTLGEFADFLMEDEEEPAPTTV